MATDPTTGPAAEDRVGGSAAEADWTVIGPDDLIGRVEALLARIDAGERLPGGVPPDGLAAVVGPVHEMRVLHRDLHPPELPSGGGPRRSAFGLLKRLIRRLTSWYVEPRWQIQEQIDARAIDFSSEVYNSLHRVEVELERLRQQNARLRLEVVATTERLRRTQQEVTDHTDRLADLDNALSKTAMEDEVRALSKEVASILARLGAEGSADADIDYVAFEERFRGSVDSVAETLKRCLSLFPPPEVPGRIVDIGCGRGEMVELLAAEGHDVVGVDINPDMIARCHAKGLPAVVDEGLHFLSRLPDNSLKGVFSAQLVEHLIVPELEALVRQAHRTLAREGVLVIESINPRSSYALGNHYFADASHVRPVHPESLRFICEQVGFSRVEFEERSPHPSLSLREALPVGPVGEAVEALLDSVFGYQDYLVVATK